MVRTSFGNCAGRPFEPPPFFFLRLGEVSRKAGRRRNSGEQPPLHNVRDTAEIEAHIVAGDPRIWDPKGTCQFDYGRHGGRDFAVVHHSLSRCSDRSAVDGFELLSDTQPVRLTTERSIEGLGLATQGTEKAALARHKDRRDESLRLLSWTTSRHGFTAFRWFRKTRGL